jgi:hypothetical protein
MRGRSTSCTSTTPSRCSRRRSTAQPAGWERRSSRPSTTTARSAQRRRSFAMGSPARTASVGRCRGLRWSTRASAAPA